MCWENLLSLRGEYYPDLLREFYANMLRKHNKHLHAIISSVKGIHIALTRESLANRLGLRDASTLI